MRETLSDVGRLRPEESATDSALSEIEVEYEIHFDTSLRTIRGGLPPVSETAASVSFIRATDGRNLPEGYYELQTHDEHLRLKHIAGAGWFVLSPSGS